MDDVARRGHPQVRRRKLARVKVSDLAAVKRSNRLFRTLDRSSQRMVGKVGGVEEFAQKLVGRVLDHFHLFEDDFLLAIQINLVETRIGEQVGNQIKRFRQTSIRNLYGEARHLMSRKSVKISTQTV